MCKSKILTISLIIFYLSALVSCSNGNSINDRLTTRISNRGNFLLTETPDDSLVRTTSILDIDDWTMDSTGILCCSYGTDMAFYRLNTNTMCLVDSFGARGVGPEEFSLPGIVRSSKKRTLLIDGNKDELILIEDGKKHSLKHKKQHRFYNSPIEIDYPLVAFYQLTPDWRSFNIIDFASGELTDSLYLYQKDQENENIKLDFRIDGNKHHAVLGRVYVDEIMILDLDKGKISRINMLEGNGIADNKNTYTIDVQCGADAFYILTNKYKTEIGDKEGCIESFDYDGNPIKKIMLKFRPKRILLDEMNHRIIAQDAEEDGIFHVIPNK